MSIQDQEKDIPKEQTTYELKYQHYQVVLTELSSQEISIKVFDLKRTKIFQCTHFRINNNMNVGTIIAGLSKDTEYVQIEFSNNNYKNKEEMMYINIKVIISYLAPIEDTITLTQILFENNTQMSLYQLQDIESEILRLSNQLNDDLDSIDQAYFIKFFNCKADTGLKEIIHIPLKPGNYEISLSFYAFFPSTYGFLRLYTLNQKDLLGLKDEVLFFAGRKPEQYDPFTFKREVTVEEASTGIHFEGFNLTGSPFTLREIIIHVSKPQNSN